MLSTIFVALCFNYAEKKTKKNKYSFESNVSPTFIGIFHEECCINISTPLCMKLSLKGLKQYHIFNNLKFKCHYFVTVEIQIIPSHISHWYRWRHLLSNCLKETGVPGENPLACSGDPQSISFAGACDQTWALLVRS